MFKPYALKKSGIATDYYFGQAQETIYSQPDSVFLPKPEDVDHLVKGGKLVQIFGDFEASDKNARTATPKDFAALAFDLQGRLLAKIKVPVAIPEHVVYAIDAAMVGHVDAKSLDKGFPEHLAAAQIQDFFKQTSHLDIAALNLGVKEQSNGKLFTYPLNLAGGRSLALDIQSGGKKFRIDGESAIHKVYGHWQPFNGEQYDDALLAHWNARLGFSNLFPSSQKRNDTIRSDMRVKALWLWAFGPQGDSGLQLGERHHKQTKRTVLGTRLEDMIRNNTVAANRARGVAGGIRLYDGREFDPERTHTSDEDSALTAALSFELRRIDPQGLRFVEEMDDADKYRKFLQGNRGFTDRPPVGFVHYDQGMLTRSIGVLMATDDAFGDRRKALLFNLAHDPRDYVNMKNDEIRALLMQRNNDPVFVPLELNKTPTVASFERAYEAGAGQDIPPEEYHRRAMMIGNNRAFIQRVMENWYELTRPTPPTKLITQREQYEDSFSHYGEPKYYVVKEAGRPRKEPKDVYKRRLQVWRTRNEFDRLLNLATQGHAVEYSNDPDAVADYLSRYADVTKKLAKLQAHWTHRFSLPPESVMSLDDARKHLWTTREACMDARFSSYSDAWVVNERGQRQPWDRVITMSDATRKRMWPVHEDLMKDAPHFRIMFERNPTRYSIITTLLAFATDKFYQTHGSAVKPEWWDAYFRKNWEPARPWYDAYVTRAVQGPPNLDPSEHKMPSEASELQRIERMMSAAGAEKALEYKRALDTPQGQQRLAAHKKYKTQRLAQHVWTPDALALMGFDNETRQPTPNPRFLVDPAKTVRLTVPDVMLENPNWHEIWGQHQVVAALQDAEEKVALKKLADQQTSLLLVGKATGMIRLAAKAVCARLPKGTEAAAAVSKAQSAYATVGGKLGPHPFLLTFEQLAPVHKMNYVNEGTQHVALPALEWSGLVDTQAGGLPTPLTVRTGLMVRDVGQDFAKGAIRLRRMQGGQETGDEYQGSIARASRITVDDLAVMKDEEAWRFGKLSAGDLHAAWRRLFADLHVDASQQVLWKIELAAPVDKTTYTYSNRVELPVAMIDKPVRNAPRRRKTSSPKPGVAE